MGKGQKYSNTNIMLAKECVGILSLPTKCKDPAEYKRVIHSERNVRHHCVIFVYLESDLSRLDACVRSVCLVRIDDAVFWSRRHLSLSFFLSLSILQKISLESHPTAFYFVATEITIVLDLVCASSRNGSQHETFL